MTPFTRIFRGVCLAALLGGCTESDAPAVHLSVGPPTNDRVTFRPTRAFAEYVELPQHRNELRITLASYEASCERFVPPEGDDVLVSVTVTTPAGKPPGPGTYAWAGLDAVGSERRPRRGYARASARIGARTHHFEPGGSIRLSAVRLAPPEPKVAGLLAFEFAGDADHPASSARGRFEAVVCRATR